MISYFLVIAALLFLSGLLLIFFTLKKNVAGRKRFFLLLTGGSLSGFFVGVILHNFFYALGIMFGRIILLKILFEALHVLFFLVAVIVCPLGLIVGVVGSVAACLRR